MKKKIFGFLVSFFLTVALWAQNPTKDFPYYYYNSYEKDYYAYSNVFRKSGTLLEDNDEWKVVLYLNGTTHYIVTTYKYGKEQTESELKRILKSHKNTYKELDSKIDNDKGTNYNVCLIFLDSGNNMICSATYSEAF